MRFIASLTLFLVLAGFAVANDAPLAQEEIEVQIPNGPVLVFPPGTSDAEILAFIEREIESGALPSPPMPVYMGLRFNRELSKILHADCTCYRLLIDGQMVEHAKPLSEKQRWDIMLAIRYKRAIPIPSKSLTH